jgi:hypothetical protein
MKLLRVCLVVAILLAVSISAKAFWAGDGRASLAQLAKDVTIDDAERRAQAVKALREAGPAGMEALANENADLIAKGPQPSTGKDNVENPAAVWERLTYALDQVGMARDSYAAGLYWYTDLEEAKAAAKASGRPILSLRLLGNLDDEFSCANSRYFRTALYANKDVSAYLRENYVLHWKSQRRVPTITIDFGDGRKIERTITGNSVHYVLDSEGNVMDALPGLYGPGAFLTSLQQAAAVVKQGSTPESRADYAAESVQRIEAQWARDLATLGIALPAGIKRPGLGKVGKQAGAPEVDLRTFSKSQAERPVLRQIFPTAQMKNTTDGAGWDRLATLHRKDAQLDSGSLRLMHDKSPLLRESSASPDDSPMAAAFTDSLALDTVRNEYLMHRTACEWIAGARGVQDLEALNTRVYTELFATPNSDQWLGLMPKDVYVALDNDGVSNKPPYR